MDDLSALSTFLTLDLDPMIHTLLVGDFNAHSPTWSPKDWISQTGAMWWIEDWATAQGLQLLSAPGVPTHWGENGARDSTINLVWCNLAIWNEGTFTSLSINWGDSYGSNHALLLIPALIIPSKLCHLPNTEYKALPQTFWCQNGKIGVASWTPSSTQPQPWTHGKTSMSK